MQPRSPVKSLYQPITGQRFLKVEPPPVSPSLSLQATSSPSSPADWAKKLTDAVLRQKAGETLTPADRDFSNADFRNITFSKILPLSFMERDGDIIKGFNFSNSKFTYSDISHLHFDECRFTYSTLSDVVCSNTKFSNSDMNEVFLQYSITTQQQPSFIDTTLKNTLIRHKANLSGVILNEPDNSSPPSVSGGGNFIHPGDIWLQMPLLWTENAVDGFLNHEHNNGKSILITIDSLPDKYSQEKVRAMEDLVKSLRSGRLTEACIRPVESSLVSVLAPPIRKVRLSASGSGLFRNVFLPTSARPIMTFPCRLLTHIISSAYCLCCWIRLTGIAPP